MSVRKVPSRRPPAGTEARDEFNRQVLGPEIIGLLEAIHGYCARPEHLLRAAGTMLTAPPGLVALPVGEEVQDLVRKIIDASPGETHGDVAHAIRRWAATFNPHGERIH